MTKESGTVFFLQVLGRNQLTCFSKPFLNLCVCDCDMHVYMYAYMYVVCMGACMCKHVCMSMYMYVGQRLVTGIFPDCFQSYISHLNPRSLVCPIWIAHLFWDPLFLLPKHWHYWDNMPAWHLCGFRKPRLQSPYLHGKYFTH